MCLYVFLCWFECVYVCVRVCVSLSMFVCFIGDSIRVCKNLFVLVYI